EDRQLEAHVDRVCLRQLALERCQAAGLGPHPVGDRRLHPEELRAQWVEVNRIAVAGDGGVAAADVARHLPDGGAAAEWGGAVGGVRFRLLSIAAFPAPVEPRR